MDRLTEINIQLAKFHQELELLFDNPMHKSTLLSRKYVSQLTNKIYVLIDDGTKNAQDSKDILLRVFQSHCTNFINNKIIYELIKCHEEDEFVDVLVARWDNYKRLLFIYHTMLMHGNDYYEMAFVNQKNKERDKVAIKEDIGVMAFPAMGVHLFDRLILRRFVNRIRKSVLQLFKQQRQKHCPIDSRLRTVFQVIWSCSLLSLARIKYTKQTICFYKQQRKQFTNHFKGKQDSQQFLHTFIMQDVVHCVAMHYSEVYANSLRLLNPFEQIRHIWEACKRQQAIAIYHLPSKSSIDVYKQVVFNELILADIDTILNRQQGFKFLLRSFNYQSSEYLPQIMTYFQVITRVEDQLIERVIKIIAQVISERGADINLKIGKSREHMTEMLGFKKSIRKIFEVVSNKTFKIEMAMQKCFKRLLDGLEVSKNLAEFTDFTIKECSRLKLDEDGCDARFKDLLLLLTSLSAKDSYLIHHQELLSKRLLDSLNEPKLQIEITFLKVLAEHLGNIMVAPHFAMLKDIETSNQFTEQFSISFPLIGYKWSLKIINSLSWPDSCSKLRFKHIQPPLCLQLHLSQLQQHYHQKFDYRFLNCKLERGTSLFEGIFSRGKYRFQAENIYMVILLHIAEQEGHAMLFGNLRKVIDDNKEEGEKASPLTNYLRVLIQSQLVKRHHTLINEPFSAGEQLIINTDYSPSEQYKVGQSIIIRPSQDMMKMFHHSNIEHSKILKERQKLIEAVLVKLLKHSHSTGNNSVTFSELFKGIREHTFLGNFNFSEAVVKQRLEELISKSYCVRDELDRRIYHYIA